MISLKSKKRFKASKSLQKNKIIKRQLPNKLRNKMMIENNF